jgi:NAD(P)H dehydrogenase (quinone)
VTVAIVGASGKTGRAVAAALRARHAPVVPIGRLDWSRLEERFAGCRAVSIIAPNLHPDEPSFVQHALASAARAGVERVVYHSVAAPYAPLMPHHVGKARAEDAVRRSGLPWTILQPCAYVQNYVPGLLGDQPAVRVPYDVNSLFGLVDLHDVAVITAMALLDDGHVGATYELGGPGLVSAADVAAEAGRLRARVVTAQSMSPDEWATSAGAALDDREREWLLAMFDYYDRYGLPAGGTAVRHMLADKAHSLRATLARELDHTGDLSATQSPGLSNEVRD